MISKDPRLWLLISLCVLMLFMFHEFSGWDGGEVCVIPRCGYLNRIKGLGGAWTLKGDTASTLEACRQRPADTAC